MSHLTDLAAHSLRAYVSKASFSSNVDKMAAMGCIEVLEQAFAATQADKYDEVLQPFVAMMRRELHANSGKGDRPGWLDMKPWETLLEIYYHTAKLQKAIKDRDYKAVAEHAADVANGAMMAADVCRCLPVARLEKEVANA